MYVGLQRHDIIILSPRSFHYCFPVRDEECRRKTLGARLFLTSFIPGPLLGVPEETLEEKPETLAITTEGENIPLILWEGKAVGGEAHKIVVDPMLTKYDKPFSGII